jgi:DNA-binding GntR family transcriptional regulator
MEPVDEILGRSATERTFRLLRAEILTCHLQPGKKLKITELQHRLRVSQAAIRESLSRLTSEGLVEAAPQRGFFVAPISEALLKDTYAARIDVESAVLTRSIISGDEEWEGNLVGAHHRLARTPEPRGVLGDASGDAWFRAHNHFHLALVAACEVKSLLRVRLQLYEQTERYRRHALPVERDIRDTEGEHRALCETAVARDVTGCVKLMQEHLQRTTEIVCAALAAAAKESRAVPTGNAQKPRRRADGKGVDRSPQRSRARRSQSI